VVLFPAATVWELGFIEIVKSGFGGPNGTICIPFTGARSYPLEDVLGIAERVNPEVEGIVRIT
jgi:hypothetical protein